MTIIHGYEVHATHSIENEIKSAILNNDPIDEYLHVIGVISNPIGFGRRYKLANEFKYRMEEEPNVKLYIVELAYNDQKFYVTDSNNKQHLQLRTDTCPLWTKENLINIGVKKLFPKRWKAMAWIDMDIEFESPSWALDALKILNGCRDVIQLFSHCVDMDKEGMAMKVHSSFGFQLSKKIKHTRSGINYFHTGYNLCMTRKAFEKMDGAYDVSILGSGDHNMMLAFIGNGENSVNKNVTDGYKQSIINFQNKCKNLRLGYVPGVIRHYFHGSKINRQYQSRWLILVNHQYDPFTMIDRDENGLIIPNNLFPQQLKDDIMVYFRERLEDD